MSRDNRRTLGLFIVAGVGAVISEKLLKQSIGKSLKVKL